MAAPLLALVRRQGATEWEFREAEDERPVGHWPLLMRRDSSSVGRHVIAARNIAAGELIYAEEAFVQTVEDALLSAVCHSCYQPIVSAEGTPSHQSRKWGCDACDQVLYCSAACQEDGKAAHTAECGMLCSLAARGVSLKAVRGLRLFVRLVHRAHKDPAAFEDVEALQEHYSNGTVERRRFFDGVSAQINKLVPPSVRLEPARLAKLVSRVHTNLFAVSDMAGIQYGSALYAKAGTLLNHSCDPAAAVSFNGSTLRVHSLRDIAAGEEVAIAYTELYAGRDERRSSMQAKKGFTCACSRCMTPPPSDAVLDGWRCLSRCDGVVPPGSRECVSCGAPHALDSTQRAAIEERWKSAVHEGLQLLQGNLGQPSVAAAESALRAAEQVLAQSNGRLCEDHVARHRARRMRVLALQSFSEARAEELMEALQNCIDGMRRHLPSTHPELAFYVHWLAKTSLRHLERKSVAGQTKDSWRRAQALALAAAESLAVSHGKDHPTVEKWRCMATS